MKFRFATTEDASLIKDIYAPYIKTTLTFETTIPDTTEMMHRIQSVTQSFPWIVVEENHVVKGYAYLSTFNPRAAYQHTADLSIYLSDDSKGQGIGKTMCELLFEIAKLQNITTIVSIITQENTGSKAFHTKLGFQHQGELNHVGYKHNRWLNISYYVKKLSEPVLPDALVSFSHIKEKAQKILDSFNQNRN